MDDRTSARTFLSLAVYCVGIGLAGFAWMIRYHEQLQMLRNLDGLMMIPLDLGLLIGPFGLRREHRRIREKLKDVNATEGERLALGLAEMGIFRQMLFMGTIGTTVFPMIGHLLGQLKGLGFGN